MSRINNLYTRYRAERSFSGYDPSALKSGIQKYGRRAELEKGLWCLVELDLFSLLECGGPALDEYLRKYPEETRKNTQAHARRIRTNMINRLVVMMSEEVNISNWRIVLIIRELYDQWVANRVNPASRKYLVDMYRYLTSQEMIRLISDLHSVYLPPPSYVKPKHQDDLLIIHTDIQRQYPQIYSGQAEVGEVSWGLDMDRYPAKLQSCMQGIIYNLEKGSDHAFYWIKKLRDFEKDDQSSKYKYMRIVWGILYRFIDQHREYEFVRETVSALEFFFKKMTHKERPIYLYHAVLLLIRRNEIDWDSTDPGIDTPIADVNKLYHDHLSGGKMPMDEYIIDLHTHRGKRSDDCLEKFALEGAYVENENVKFLRQDYREIYVMLKQELDLYHRGNRRLK